MVIDIVDSLYRETDKQTCNVSMPGYVEWQYLHDDNKTCKQSSYWELILENGQ
jgi:hypothetical protein